MSEAQPLFAVLQQSADADCVAPLERLVREAPDRKLSRINVLDFARREGLDEERTIAAGKIYHPRCYSKQPSANGGSKTASRALTITGSVLP